METVKIGIIGGGQLGKMMILEAKRLGFYIVVLDPTPHCPAHSIADKHIVAEYNDQEAFFELAGQVDIVTYEFEHIQVEALSALENKGHKVYPSSEILNKIQNKYKQKKWLQEANIPVAPFRPVDSINTLKEIGLEFSYPLVLKTCTGGYDGKGNYVITNESQVEEAYEALGSGQVPLMAEAFVPFQKEISIIIGKTIGDAHCIYPISENKHRDSILDETIVPARIDTDTKDEALKVAEEVSRLFTTRGILCIEMFVTNEGKILVNELAPRPHNSGHYTIEGCVTSQFEQHIRGVVGLPLGETQLLQPTVMKNIIGQVDSKLSTQVVGMDKVLAIPYVQLHLYEKEVRRGRKMGHITSRGSTIEEALQRSREAHKHISYKG